MAGRFELLLHGNRGAKVERNRVRGRQGQNIRELTRVFEVAGGVYSDNHRSASWALPVTESVALPPIRGRHHAPVSTPVVHHSIRCNWAPRLSEVQGPYHARQHRASTRPGRRLAYV